MNLEKSIRRILREEGFIPLPIKRRISYDEIEEAFDNALERMGWSMNNPDSIIYKEKGTTLKTFAHFVIDEMVTYIEQDYFNDNNRIYFSDNDEDYKIYHEKIRKPLLRYYGKRIKEKYDEVIPSNDEEIIQESIRRILKEERDLSKIIVKLLDRLIVSKYEDVCKIKVVHSSVTSDYSFYRVIVYFKQGTEKRSRTWEENVLNEVWEYVHDVFGFSVALHSVRVLSCDDMSNEENSGKLDEDIVDARFKKINLQESIRRILKEERSLRSKLLKTIDTVGFLPASNIVGGIEKLFDILGYDSLTDDMKIKLIKEIILETDDEYITLMVMNESPIIVHDENGVISQIEMLYPNDVALFHYGGYEYSQDLGETYRHYENLPKDILDDIFNMVVGYYLEVF